LRTEDQLLFPDPRGGVVANKVLNRWYRDLATESGVRRITSHGARHTAGSSYAVVSAGQKVIGALLGRSDSREVHARRPECDRSPGSGPMAAAWWW
jgi:integrase